MRIGRITCADRAGEAGPGREMLQISWPFLLYGACRSRRALRCARENEVHLARLPPHLGAATAADSLHETPRAGVFGRTLAGLDAAGGRPIAAIARLIRKQ
jgi:hypothetical protein